MVDRARLELASASEKKGINIAAVLHYTTGPK
jgi:hypothetical protein